MVCSLTDLLAGSRIGGPHLLLAQTYCFQRRHVGQVEDRAELDLVLEEMSWHEVVDCPAAPGGETVKLGRGDLDRAGEIEGGEAAGGIPAATDGPGAGTGLGVLPLDRLVPEDVPREFARGQVADRRGYVSGRHREAVARLDEDALGESLDHSEDPPVLTGGEQVDRLVVAEHLARGEQPVVRSFRFQHPR